MPSDIAEIGPAVVLPDAPSPRRMKLTALDLQTLQAGLIADDEQIAEVQQLVLDSAWPLAGPSRNEARICLLAKAIAITRAKILMQESLLDARLTVRDEQGVRLVSKVLDGARRHLIALVAEHRLACGGVRRSPITVAVGQAGAVNVTAGAVAR